MRAQISFRVGIPLWSSEARCRDLLRLFAGPGRAVTEVAFFTGITHPPVPLAVIRERAAALAGIMPSFRAAGLRAGINHLATLGHLDENLPNSLDRPWQHLVDISGAVSPSCYCAEDPDMQGYTRDCYRALADADPEFIWIDDDVRMESHGGAVRFACFCDRCMARFSEENGHEWTRPALVRASAAVLGSGVSA